MKNSPIYYLHFLSKKYNSSDFSNRVQVFLEGKLGFTNKTFSGSTFAYVYKMPKFDFESKFEHTDVNIIGELYKINSSYNNLNFHLEIDLFTPNFFAGKMFEICRLICKELDCSVYSELFENVITFNYETVLESFKLAKRTYLQKYPTIQKKYYLLDSKTLNDTLDYIFQMDEINKHYGSEYSVERPRFYIDNMNKVYVVSSMGGQTSIFPPYFDYLAIKNGDSLEYIKYKDFFEATNKFLGNVAGINNALLINPRKADKVKKILFGRKIQRYKMILNEVSLYQVID